MLVYTVGVFDLLHVGHVRFLTKARALGESLIVGIPTDRIVKQDKGQYPVIPVDQRKQMLLALKVVDACLVYDVLDFLPSLKMVRPDIFAVGEFWGNDERHRAADQYMLDSFGVKECVSYTAGVSSSIIRNQRDSK